MLHTPPDQPIAPSLATPNFTKIARPENDALFGPLGLRAGWGILLFFVLSVVLVVLLFISLFKVTGRMGPLLRERSIQHQAQRQAKAKHQPIPHAPLQIPSTLLAECAEAGAVLGAALALSFIERRRFGNYGLLLRRLRDVLPGAVVGLLSISLLVGILRALHLLVFDGRLLHGGAVVRYGAGWLGVFVLVGVFEEFFFRGYIQFTLMRGLLDLGARLSPAQPQRAAFWLAALIWSLLFCLTHVNNAGEDPMGIAMVFAAGILFSYALWRTGSLWWGIGFHMTWDWGQSFLFGVPDSGNLSAGRLFATHAAGHPLLSGGPAGPEGSVLVLPVLLLVAGVIRLHRQAPQPAVEPTASPLPLTHAAGSTIS